MSDDWSANVALNTLSIAKQTVTAACLDTKGLYFCIRLITFAVVQK